MDCYEIIPCKSALLLHVNWHKNLFFLFAVKNAEKPPVLKSVAPKEDESPKSVSPPNVKEDSIKTAKTQEKRKSSQKRKVANK